MKNSLLNMKRFMTLGIRKTKTRSSKWNVKKHAARKNKSAFSRVYYTNKMPRFYYQCPSTNLFSTACVTSTQSFRWQLDNKKNNNKLFDTLQFFCKKKNQFLSVQFRELYSPVHTVPWPNSTSRGTSIAR